MPFERTEQQKPHKRRVVGGPLQKRPAYGLEKFFVIRAGCKPIDFLRTRIPLLARLVLKNGAVEFFFRTEISKNDRFIHARLRCQIARRSPAKSLFGKELHRCLRMSCRLSCFISKYLLTVKRVGMQEVIRGLDA